MKWTNNSTTYARNFMHLDHLSTYIAYIHIYFVHMRTSRISFPLIPTDVYPLDARLLRNQEQQWILQASYYLRRWLFRQSTSSCKEREGDNSKWYTPAKYDFTAKLFLLRGYLSRGEYSPLLSTKRKRENIKLRTQSAETEETEYFYVFPEILHE